MAAHWLASCRHRPPTTGTVFSQHRPPTTGTAFSQEVWQLLGPVQTTAFAQTSPGCCRTHNSESQRVARPGRETTDRLAIRLATRQASQHLHGPGRRGSDSDSANPWVTFRPPPVGRARVAQGSARPAKFTRRTSAAAAPTRFNNSERSPRPAGIENSLGLPSDGQPSDRCRHGALTLTNRAATRHYMVPKMKVV